MKWFLIMLLLMIPLTSAVLIVGDDDFNINEQRGIFLERIPTNISAADVNQTGNSLFWRLDGGNAPPTSIWNMGDFGFNNLGETNMTGNLNLDDNSISFKNLLTQSIKPCELLGLCLEANVFRLIGFLQVLGDTVNDNVTMQFLGSTSGKNGTIIFDSRRSHFNINTNLTIEGLYFGNGSQLTGVCLSNGTNCQSVAGADQNLTNVAFLNNTQTFTGNNTFSGNVTLQDNSRLSLGTEQNSQIYYDETDSFWDLRNSGSGDLMIALETGFPSPDPNNVHIWSGNAGAVTPGANRQLVIENDGGAGMTFLSPNTDTQRISFGDPESNNVGQIAYRHGDDIMRFRIAGATRLDYFANNFQFQEATTIDTSTGSLNLSSAIGQVTVDGNLSVQEFYFGNGSQLTDVCLTDGTNCQSDFEFNNTNVAYLNNSNNFTVDNFFEKNVFIDGNLSSSDGIIDIARGVNLSWDIDQAPNGCLKWKRTIESGSNSICGTSSLLELSTQTLSLNAQTVDLGKDVAVEQCLGFRVSGTNGAFCFQSDSPARYSTGASPGAIEFKTWYGSATTNFFSNNVSWSDDGAASELLMSVPIVRIVEGGLNASGDLCAGTICMSHLVNSDTNATTECSGDEVLLGNSSCATLSDFIVIETIT